MLQGKPGECLLIETNTDIDGIFVKHLFVILTESQPITHNVIIVGIESVRPKCDSTVMLRPGDHEFVVRDSFVNYRRARIISLDELSRLVGVNKATVKAPFQKDVLDRIRDGISKSRFTPFEVVDFYQDILFRY